VKILLDNCVPRKIRTLLSGHEVFTARKMALDEVKNGALLRAAAQNGFDVLISVDKKIRFEHNLRTLAVPVILLDIERNGFAGIEPFTQDLQTLLNARLDRILYFIRRDHQVIRLGLSE
jgi:hypothetical protein